MARFCTEKWDIKSSTNYDTLTMHLTNYAVNKDNQNYKEGDGEHGVGGSKRSLKCILDSMAADRVDTTKLMADIEELIVQSLIAVQPELSHQYRTSQPSDIDGDMCFELLGYDIYIDAKCRPWLLEANLAPSFQTDEEIDYNLKYHLIKDMFRVLNATHKERLRKQNRKKQEMERRILERTKDKQARVLERVETKVPESEFKQIYPVPNSDPKYERYAEYLLTS